jgi:hypothetical protein
MLRLLAGSLVLLTTLALPGAAATVNVQTRPATTMADSDVSAARRCNCAERRVSHVRVVRRYSKRVAMRLPLRLGYDPVPYRFGYVFPPYRYIDRYAIVRARSAVYR